MLAYLAAIGAALLLGWSFVAIWRRIVSAEASALFWRSFVRTSGTVLSADEFDHLMAHYRTLIGLVARYLGRSLLGVAAASVPTVLALLFVAPPAVEAWDGAAGSIEVYPPGIPVSINGRTVTPDGDGRARRPLDTRGTGTLKTAFSAVETVDLAGRYGFCRPSVHCAVLASLAFRVTVIGEEPGDGVAYVVIRPSRGDVNVLWPFLSDLEFSFLVAFVCATFVGYVATRRRA